MVAVASPSSNVQRMLTLRTFPAFSALAPDELVVMAEQCTDHFFAKGEVISKGGVPVRGLHLVVEGKVQILRDGKPYRLMNERESVGGIASLTQDPRGVDAVAVEDTTTLSLTRERMEDVFEDNFAIMSAVMRVLARTLVEARQLRGSTAGFAVEKEHAGEHRAEPLDLMDRIFFLTRTLSFSGASIESLAELASGAQEVRYAPGDVLWNVGDAAGHLVAIHSGLIACATAEAKQQFVLGAGSTAGGMDALAADPRWFGATAQTPVVALRVEIEDFFDLFEDNVEMSMAMMRTLAFAIERQYEAMMAGRDASA